MDRTPAHLADMLQFVQEALALGSGLQMQQFTANRVLCLAVEKLFINIGEAARRVAPQVQAAHPAIPWSRVIGLRNILAHGYEQVEHEVLYKSIRDDLPALEQSLRKALEALG